MIKTVLLGAPELVSGAVGGVRRVKVLKKLKDAQKFADAHGINTGPTAIKSSLVESVERMTPDEFAANQPQLRKQLMDAEIAQKKAVTQKFEEAKTTDAYVNADNIEDFGRGLRDELVREGYDLDEMAKVQKTLGDIENIRATKPGVGKRDNLGEFGSGAVPKTFQRGKVIDVQLNDLQLIRKRINKRFSTDASQNSSTHSSLRMPYAATPRR
jgi:hypothetical protein